MHTARRTAMFLHARTSCSVTMEFNLCIFCYIYKDTHDSINTAIDTEV